MKILYHGIVLCLLFFFFACRKAERISKADATASIIKTTYFNVEFEPDGFSRLKWLHSKGVSDSELVVFVSDWSRNPQKTIEELDKNAPPIKDAWGHDLRVRWRSKEDAETLLPGKDLIIWSVGPNGINENCSGDDVVVSWKL